MTISACGPATHRLDPRCFGVWRAMADRAEAGLNHVDGVLPWINCINPLV